MPSESNLLSEKMSSFFDCKEKRKRKVLKIPKKINIPLKSNK